MKRRVFLKVSTLSCIMLFACNKKQTDKYTHYLEPEAGKETTLEGEIIHVCPIEGKKMKLRLSDGEIICVLPAIDEPFAKTQWDQKKVKITGLLQEAQLPRTTIVANYQDKKILCHIDHSPCTDIRWIENRWKDGSAERLLERDNENLQQRMYKTKLNYVQIFSITANQIVEV
ncbi:MAG: hypothetical protein LBU37_06140 [Tannerellaceae bacterium]|jgi:hypothetical protein|nr:hypothetical protein [Tannerellaceae bacterium]